MVVCGVYPSSACACDVLALVRGTSPGGSATRLLFARTPRARARTSAKRSMLHMMVAKIKDLLLRTQRERRGNALHDIVNVCKVA